MKALRHGAFLAALAGTAFALPAADRIGPGPDEIIQPRAASAANTADDDAATGRAMAGIPQSPSVGGMFQAVGYVVALLALAVGGIWLVKRGGLPRPFARNDGRLHVLETRLLGNKQFLVVVEYDDAKMLLGVCPGRIDYLTPLAGHLLASDGARAGEDEIEPPPAAAALARLARP
jgi:flagellar protein FliO/FliZ